jgi:hypothetical protein
MNKKHTMKFALPLAFGIALSLVTGCSKQEKAGTDSAEKKTPEVQNTTAAAAPVIKTVDQTVTPAKLLPLPAEVMALVASNRNATAYEQIFYVTNSSFTDVQKAQALMQILPTFTSHDEQHAAAHAITDYVSDSTHALVSQPLIEGRLHPRLLSVFMTDTLKRPEAIKIPVLKSIAAKKDHPLQAEAQELLAAFSKPLAVQQQASNRMD